MSSVREWVSARPLRTLVLLSLFLFLSGNWILPLTDRDEARFAEASREMLQRRDLVIPWFNGQYRFDKPPFIYWCQMACYRCLGENAFAARLPSALFATAVAVVLLLWGRRLGNERAGFYAGLMVITCLQFLIHGRFAVADMPMVFFVTVAVWSGWELTRPEVRCQPRWWWLFYCSLGLGFLAKGPVAWLPFGGLLLSRWLRPNQFKIPVAKTILGLLLTLLVIGTWGLPALMRTRGQFFSVGIGHHVIFRSFGIMEGHGLSGVVGWLALLPLYFGTFFLSFFPWSLRVPRALKWWWPQRGQDLLGWYLLLQIALIFSVFTLVRTKLPHYTLPAFPAIAFWLALRVTEERRDDSDWVFRRVELMCLLLGLVTLVLFPFARPYFASATLWHKAEPFCSPQSRLATVEYDEPSLVWEFRKGVTNYMEKISLSEVADFCKQPGPRILILPTRLLNAELRNDAGNAMEFRSAGIDTVSLRRIDLTALVKPAE